uniref:Polycystin cation channel PKD1/PKD2 domain-containing protein n=1 Tax=Chromera velia CCMP2878 TaxID=1169474 RepID=A0A0G4HFF2_9ALVE|eukprot:Cvel_6611.t1-p1 / transcript=Cvel_6611.t1 / gene=Cvel_6611 / organism=Chromera_velia_CCMP2878 / gene_product=Polycystic kidney disease 2-like 1 protein, putative / transcript_product=Polycystic kidney disease 2-like 1 protein, putative / location=Cvel_scaffold327:39654-51170(-) / protein_length=1344 / sequence_SO=supercontig / SO=protein_coding / is_pseudo=false
MFAYTCIMRTHNSAMQKDLEVERRQVYRIALFGEDFEADNHLNQKSRVLRREKLRSRERVSKLQIGTYMLFLGTASAFAFLAYTSHPVYLTYTSVTEAISSAPLSSSRDGEALADVASVADVADWMQGAMLDLFIPNNGGYPGRLLCQNQLVPPWLRLTQRRKKLTKTGDSRFSAFFPYRWENADTGVTAGTDETAFGSEGEFVYEGGKGYMDAGGFVLQINLTSTSPTAAEQVSSALESGFLDRQTSSLVVEFCIFNANLNAATYANVIFLVNSRGFVESEVEAETVFMGTDSLPAVACAAVASFLSFVYLGLEVRRLRQIGATKYFLDPWSIFDLLSSLLAVAACLMFVISSAGLDSLSMYKFSLGGFGDTLTDAKTGELFSDILARTELWREGRRVTAVMLIVSWMRFLKFLSRVQPRLGLLAESLGRSASALLLFSLIVVVLFFGFVFFCTLNFGNSVEEFSTLANSAALLFNFLLGEVDELSLILESDFWAAVIFFVAYVMVFFFVILNMYLAVLATAYSISIRNVEEQEEEDRALAVNKGDDEESEEESDEDEKELQKKRRRQQKHLATVKGTEEEQQEAEERRRRRSLEKEAEKSKNHFKIWMILAIWSVSFLLFYCLMVAFQLEPENRREAAMGVSLVLEGTGAADIGSREDLIEWVEGDLTEALFSAANTTQQQYLFPSGITAGEADGGGIYYPLVLGGWNVILGSSPVRMSLRLMRMDSFSPDALVLASANASRSTALVENKRTSDAEIEGTSSFSVEEPITELEDLGCTFTSSAFAEKGAYECFISADATNGTAMLHSLATSSSVMSDNLTVLSVDFVNFNANLDIFTYSVVAVSVQPTGSMSASLSSKAFRGNVYDFSKTRNVIRVVFEAFAVTLFLSVLFMALKRILIDTCKRLPKEDELLKKYEEELAEDLAHGNVHAGAQKPKLKSWPRKVAMWCTSHTGVFDLMDFLLCCIIAASLSFWIQVLTEAEAVSNFPLPPTGDQNALLKGARQVTEMLDDYARLAAVATPLVFLRSLRIFSLTPRLTILTKTLGAAAMNLLWFIVMLVVIMAGYVCAGMVLLSPAVEALREADGVIGPPFYFSYIILFYFVFVNFFMAIVAEAYAIVKRDLAGKQHFSSLDIVHTVKMLKAILFKPKAPEKKDVDDVASEEFRGDARDSFSDLSETDGGAKLQRGHLLEELSKVKQTDDDMLAGMGMNANIGAQPLTPGQWARLDASLRQWVVEEAGTMVDLFRKYETRRVVAGGQHESLERLLLDIQTEAFERLKVLDAECIREEKEVEEKNALLTSSLRPDLEALDHFIAYMESALYARKEEFKRLKNDYDDLRERQEEP